MSKKSALSFFLLWWMCTQSAAAIDLNVDMATGLRRYVIPMQDCPIEFAAKKDGHARAAMSSGGPYGYFSELYWPEEEGRDPLDFSVSCHKGAAVDLCPKLLPAEDVDYEKYFNVSYLNKWHPIYFSIARISSHPLYTSGPGQVRTLYFCLGDNSHTLDGGGIVLGYDIRDVSETVGKQLQKSSEVALPEALEVIKSIRFISTDDE